jgi:hypothetical protein
MTAGAAAPSAAPRKPSAAVMAALDAHRADKAAKEAGGQRPRRALGLPATPAPTPGAA